MNQITKSVSYNFEKKQAAPNNWTILTCRSCVIRSWWWNFSILWKREPLLRLKVQLPEVILVSFGICSSKYPQSWEVICFLGLHGTGHIISSLRADYFDWKESTVFISRLESTQGLKATAFQIFQIENPNVIIQSTRCCTTNQNHLKRN